jgi:hypothetical protein
VLLVVTCTPDEAQRAFAWAVHQRQDKKVLTCVSWNAHIAPECKQAFVASL